MFNPIKMNLYQSGYCPFDNYDRISYNVGGNPNEIISKINNNVFNYLQGLYVDKKSGKRNEIYFKFNNEINKKQDVQGSTYLGKGGITGVFAIKYIQAPQSTSVLAELVDKNLIIRIMDSFKSDDIDQWINKYIEEKKIFEENLIDIYMYGGIVSTKNKFIGFYTITRYYYDWTEVIKLNYSNTLNYFHQMLKFLIKLEENNYSYRDLKMTNIGLDQKDSKYNFIVLDYDDITLINNKSDNFFNQFNSSGCLGKYCAGTMIPYFIIKDYLTLSTNWFDKLNKLYVVGLAEIMMYLFFYNDQKFNNVLIMLYSPCKYPSCIHYYQYIDLFDNKEKNNLFEFQIINMTPKFHEINLIKKNILIYLILNLLEKDYNKINSPKIIIDEIKTQIIDMPTYIKNSKGETVLLDDIKFLPISNSSDNFINDFVGGKSKKYKNKK